MTPHTLWLPHHGPLPLLGDTIHVQTFTSRRRATVVATKPGHALLSLAMARTDASQKQE